MRQKDHEIVEQGLVVEALPSAIFRVKIGERIILAHLSGKMRMYRIKVMPGDKVAMKISPDGSRGIIVRRF